jgi:single-strand DNA-binding protein
MTVNKVILVGNLGADPESRTTQSGSTVANLRIATTERAKDREGNWTDHTEWHRVACFGRTAENVAKYCRKGKQLYIEGKIRTRKWQDRDGNDRWSTEVIADQIRFLGGRAEGAGGYDAGPSAEPATPAATPAAAPAGGYSAGGGGGNIDDDIPF